MGFRVRILFLAAVMILSASGAFARHSGQSTGFEANGVYSTEAIDGINLFNGCLSQSLPTGDTYRVESDLSYSFSPHYNPNPWNHKESCKASGYLIEESEGKSK